jgi:hypothetical protein
MASATPNIDDQGVVLRLRRSVYAFAGALLTVAILQWQQAPWPYYLFSAFFFYSAFWLAYQGLFKT